MAESCAYSASLCLSVFDYSGPLAGAVAGLAALQIIRDLIITQTRLIPRQQKLMTDQEALRQTVLRDSDTIATKRRFGLFSHPVSTAVGDNGGYKKKIRTFPSKKDPRDPQTNKPITEPRNFYTSPNKKGQRNSDLFGNLNPLAASHVKDEFIEPNVRLMKEEKQKFDQGKKHQVSFFTGTGNKILAKPAYEYVEQKNPEEDPKRHRDADGKVKCDNRNFYTNRSSTVETTFFKPYTHIDDPFDRAHQKQLQYSKRNKSMEQEAKFRPNSFVPQLINSERKVRELDGEIKKKESKEPKLNIYNHQNPWKSSSPNKSGIYGSLEPFPKYIENPPKERTKKQTSTQLKKEPFKLMSPRSFATPSVSISLHRSNILRGRH